jgi:nitrate reductase gamma subunit
MNALQIFFYLSFVVFVVGTLYKLVKLARMPLHLRWDLYPIPHEKGRSEYGGSYYEEINWWTKPARVSLVNEYKEMLKEIIFIQSMYHNNRPLWIWSFPFHFGLYLSVGFVLLVYLAAILSHLGMAFTAGSAGIVATLIVNLTIICGVAGAILGLFGAIGLLLMRIGNRELRTASVWTDYFNVILLGAVFLTTIWSWATIDPNFNAIRGYVSGIVSFSAVTPPAQLLAVHLFLASLFLFWLPFTHMTHFVGKYFTYHKVRWEDHPNIKGTSLEKAVMNALGYHITWSAPHIKKGATWAEAATASEEKKEN